MNIAKEVATRSTCDRKYVGAVIVREKTILSTGYNGSIKGLPHCDEAGHEMVDGQRHRAPVAKINALVSVTAVEIPEMGCRTVLCAALLTPKRLPSVYQAYLFDLDGTLVDTAPDLSTALNYALRKSGHPDFRIPGFPETHVLTLK